MDNERKKQLMFEYKNRRPQMGIISFVCTATGQQFVGCSKDTKADINSHSFKATTGTHPNKPMQALWNKYGETGFAIDVTEVLPYDEKDESKDYSEDLEQLLCLYMEEKPEAVRLR